MQKHHRVKRRASYPRLAPAVLALALLPAACGVTGPDDPSLREEIEARREQWEARPFRDYAARLQRECFCLPEARGPVRVEVRQGRVARVVEPDSGELVEDRLWHLFPPVDGLFVVLLEAVEGGADDVEVEWDPGLGFPTRIFIDYDRRTADEELGFRVESVAPLD